MEEYRVGESVRVKNRNLKEATFYGWSKSGKRIGVKHNYVYPYGVGFVVDWFSPKNIEKVR